MSLIRKHATVLAALSVLLCAVAAPYLIPENPDSPIFRSGTLGLILLTGCFMPVHAAYRRADRRTLTVSLCLGFLFALALSLGSELFIYDGLVRGLGSFVRRAAVPLLAAPLFGGLIASALQAKFPHGKPLHLPLPVFALILFVCWLPLLLAYFPGMLNYDFPGQYSQHLDQQYSSIHPLLHSALCNGIITLGESLHSRTFGVLLMSLLQMALFALALGYSCTFVQRRGAPAPVTLAMLALYALHPVFSVMALSMTKDTLFAAAIVVLSLLAFELIEAPEAFLRSKRRCALFVLCAIGSGLLRNNGVFVLALLLPSIVLATRTKRKATALLCGAGVAGCLTVTLALTLLLSPSSLPSFQLYSLPAQQLVRAYNSERMSEADRDEIRSWYTDEQGLVVHAHLADSAKGYLDRERIASEGGDFLRLWARLAPDYAQEYIEAFLMLNIGSWYPDDLSHSTIYPDVSWNDKGYLQTQEFEVEGIETTCFLPAVRDFYEQICRRNAYQDMPVISVLFCTATPFWALLFAAAAFIAKRQTRALAAWAGVMGLWLSYLLGPCTLPRYTLPLFCLAPAMLGLALCASLPHFHVKEISHDSNC